MDKEESLLRAFEKMQLTNEILQLEQTIAEHEFRNDKLANKSKEMIEELVKNNAALSKEKANLITQVNELSLENSRLQNVLKQVPGFILKFFARKNIKLLNGGDTNAK